MSSKPGPKSAAPLAPEMLPQTLRLACQTLALEFSLKPFLALTSLQGAPQSSPQWMGAPSQVAQPLWKLSFKDAQGKLAECASTQASVSQVEMLSTADAQPTRARITLQAPLPGSASCLVSLEVRLDADQGLSFWSLGVKELPADLMLTRVDFPCLGNFVRHPQARLAAPVCVGLEQKLAPQTSYEGTYPSWSAAMQFLAVYAEGQGLYFGTHDPNANHKQFNVEAAEQTFSVGLSFWPPCPQPAPKSFQLPFEVALGTFSGSYCEAARIYRRFAETTRWGNLPAISQRAMPEWLKEVELWLRPDGSPEANVELTLRALKYFDVPTACHWYRWHVIPYDTLYPEYLPALPGFAEGVRAMQQAGAHVIPYINGRLWDPASNSWKEENAQNSAALQENGEFYSEIYPTSNVPLHVMCPYTRQWQQKVIGLVKQLVAELGVDGVYIDQIGAAAACTCHNSSHGHPKGGGDFWQRGYRALLEELRGQLPEQTILTTEENAECWADLFDAQLIVNTPTDERTPIPLFVSVYGQRVLTYGFQTYAPDDLMRHTPFRVKVMFGFLWGAQPGWIQPARIMAPEAAGEAEFLRALVRCRRFAHPYVTGGEFLGTLDPEGDNPRIQTEATPIYGGGVHRIDLPAVVASAWKGEDASLGVLMANHSDAPHQVSFELPFDKAGMRAGQETTVEHYGPEGLLSSGRLTQSRVTVTIPARSAALFRAK